MGYTPKDKLTKIHIGDKGLVAKLPTSPKVVGKTSGKVVVSKLYAAPLISAFEQAEIEVTADRIWGDVSVDFYERPVDTASLSEVFSKLFSKVALDTTQSSDLISNKAVSKVLVDTPDAYDTVYKASYKVLSDTTVNSDVFSRVFNAVRIFEEITDQSELLLFNTAKAVVELFDVGDILDKASVKVLSDTTSKSDVFSRVVIFNRSFTEIINATDDFYGVMNVDDDQTAWVDKRVSDYGATSERFSKVLQNVVTEINTTALADERRNHPQIVKFDTFTRYDSIVLDTTKSRSDTSVTSELRSFIAERVYNEEAVNSELNRKSLDKPFTETTSNSELEYIYVNKAAIDIVDQLEVLSKDITAIRSGLADAYDTMYKAFSTGYLDTFTNADSYFKHIAIVVNEVDYFASDYCLEDYNFRVVHATDSITDFKFYKVFNDTVDSTDDFYGETNVDDDQIATVNKYASESTTLTEVFTRNVTFLRSFTETLSKSETISVALGLIKSDIVQRADTITKTLNKVASDSVQSSETKSANMQSYFLSNYVAPGYVGTNYTL